MAELVQLEVYELSLIKVASIMLPLNANVCHPGGNTSFTKSLAGTDFQSTTEVESKFHGDPIRVDMHLIDMLPTEISSFSLPLTAITLFKLGSRNINENERAFNWDPTN